MNLLIDIPLTKENNLLKIFEEIHDFIYSNDGLSPQQTLEEFVKILFIKIYDEITKTNLFKIDDDEWKNIKSGKNSSSYDKEILKLFELTKKTFINLFDIDERIKLSTISLAFTINKLQNTSILNSSQDAKGLAFQKFLSHHEKNNIGQFFTPEPIIDFCVNFIQPKPTDVIIDPACGSGAFLISYLNYIKKYNKDIDISFIVENQIYGVDINKSILRIANMKLILEANVNTKMFCSNTLDDINSLKLLLDKFDGFDIILTNPPFGAKITNSSVLNKFILGHKWKKNIKTVEINSSQNVEILFIERCLDILKNGGIMAIVLPNGIFENPSLEYLRVFIKQNAKILAIINLPQETFIPYGTGIKTSILFLEKNKNCLNEDYQIFFGRITKLGYQGNKNGTPVYLKDNYGNIQYNQNGNPNVDEDFSNLIQTYHNFKKNKNINELNSFSISSKELKSRFDFDFYAPENRNLINKFNLTQTVKLGDVCEIVKFKSNKLKYLDSIVEYIELSDISTHSFEIINSTSYSVHDLPSRASYELKTGDIITSIAGNSVGTKKHATAFVTEEYNGAICTNGFRILRTIKINPFFLLYFLHSDLFLKQMFMYRTGATIPSVSDSDIHNIIINIPENSILEEIIQKVRNSFELRQKAKHELDSIIF